MYDGAAGLATIPTASVDTELGPSSAVITGRGWYAPDDILTNGDIARTLDAELLARWVAENKWCKDRLNGGAASAETHRRVYAEYVGERIGITTRHVVDREAILTGRASSRGVYASDLGSEACRRALADARVDADDIALLICGTSSPDRIYPSTATEIQEDLGARRLHAWDLLGACSSFVYGLHVANGLIKAGIHRRVMVVAAEYFTVGVNYREPNNAFFWGDAAAAVVLERADLAAGKPGFHLVDTHCVSVPSQAIRTGLGGTRAFSAVRRGEAEGAAVDVGGPSDPFFFQEGRRVYRDMVPIVVQEARTALSRVGVGAAQIQRFWMHQASKLLLDAVATRLLGTSVDDERIAMSLSEFGNTSSCGAPLTFARDAETRPGDLGCMCVFGAGYTVGVAILRHLPHVGRSS